MYGQKQDIYTCRKIWSSGADPAVFYCGGTDDPASFGHHPRTLADHKRAGFPDHRLFPRRGIGAAFINAGLLTLAAIGTIYFLGMEMDGHTITSSCLMFGFSLFGKNLMNIWAILLGVYLYSKYHKTHMSRYIYIGFYGTSLSPIITQIMYITELPYLGQAAIKHPGGNRHRLCAAASGYPCPLCP